MKKTLACITAAAVLLLLFSHRAFSVPVYHSLKGEITDIRFAPFGSNALNENDFYSLFDTDGVGDDVIFSYSFGYPLYTGDLYFVYNLSFGNVNVQNHVGGYDVDDIMPAFQVFGMDNPYYAEAPIEIMPPWTDPWALYGTITDYTNFTGTQDLTIFSKADNGSSGVEVSFDFTAARPIPEPATAFLLGGGLIVIYIFRKKFKR